MRTSAYHSLLTILDWLPPDSITKYTAAQAINRLRAIHTWRYINAI